MRIDCWMANEEYNECYVHHKSNNDGVGHFLKELVISFKVFADNIPVWHGCWAMVCGKSIIYDGNEKDLFDADYPGIWDEIVEACKDPKNFNMHNITDNSMVKSQYKTMFQRDLSGKDLTKAIHESLDARKKEKMKERGEI